jgi:galactonate dehydratase
MKIRAVETYKMWGHWVNWLFVKVLTDEPEIYGWGEASLHGSTLAVETAIHEMAETLIGRDPTGVEAHWYRLYHGWRWRGGAILQTALAGLDGALWDIEGKRLGVPVYRLLGGPLRDRFRNYASHWAPGAKTPEDAARWAREAKQLGYTAFKWSPVRAAQIDEIGEAAAIGRGAEMMAAAREAAGPEMDIAIECGEGFTPRTAVLAGQALAPYRPLWFEEPIGFENAKAMAQLKRELPVPIAAGERILSRYEFRELVELGAVDVYQPDLMHAGGITEVKKIASLVDTYYRPIAPHVPGGPVMFNMTLHLAAAIPNFLILEDMEHDRELRESILTTPPPKREKGAVLLPEGPGLGVDLDVEKIKARPYQPQPQTGRSAQPWR